ncbi:unnamed protein product, partial [Nesidiocoris tenuis]
MVVRGLEWNNAQLKDSTRHGLFLTRAQLRNISTSASRGPPSGHSESSIPVTTTHWYLVHLRHPSRLFYASATTQLYVTCGSTLPNWSMVADLILNFEPTSSEGNSGKGNEFRVMERDKDGDRSGGEQKEND